MVRISVIIPTYNEAHYIGKTLCSLKQQKYNDFEVILADSMSTDGTAEVAKFVYKGIKVCEDHGRGAPRAYNKAARMAKGKLLLFIDADTSISKGLLQAYDNVFKEEEEVVAATGPLKPLEQTTWGTRMGFRIVSVYIVKILMLLHRPSIIGSNFMVTRKAYAKVKGMKENLITYYDWDLAHRLGKIGRIAYVDDAVAYTSVRRVKKWGPFKYFSWHLGNAMLYQFKHKARDDYEIVR